jgi:hypothetical protein
MTETRRAEQRLADAFRAIADPSEAAVPDRDVERIWLAVSGLLPAEERRALVDQVAARPAYAEAWRVAHEMWQAAPGHTVPPAHMPVTQPARRWTPQWLTAAAVLLIGTTIGLVSLREQPRVDEFRSSPGYVVQSRVAEAGTMPREAFRLQWAPGPRGSRYRIRVTTEDLTVVTTAADLEVPEFLVAAPLLAQLPPGATVLWQVDAYLPDGERVTSRTFVTHIR